MNALERDRYERAVRIRHLEKALLHLKHAAEHIPDDERRAIVDNASGDVRPVLDFYNDEARERYREKLSEEFPI